MAPASVTARPLVQRREVPEALLRALPTDMDPVLRRVYAARHADSSAPEAPLSALQPIGSLGGVGAAAEWLADLRARDASVLVVGDFDADGATASALALTALRAMGFTRVTSLVPNRFEFGYGLSPAVVDLAAQRKPDVIITVDNGISSIDGVARARDLGIDVLVTDHHLPGTELPDARAIVNPNLPGEGFASRALAGVGVVFYLMAGLARELGRRGLADFDAARRAVAATLDLVALGTVADLVPLDHNNRILVGEGLRRIRSGHARTGLAALFAVAGRTPHMARSADLGFAIAPRLNAAGRLEDMSLGIDCLMAPEWERALVLARRLDALNSERRQLQARMVAEAGELLDALHEFAGDRAQPAYCLHDPRWHEGVVGLVASRVKERTGRPVVAFAPAAEAGALKGSARSVEGLHIRDVLVAVDARGDVPGLRFGGHAMAAGLRLPETSLEAFRAAFLGEVMRATGGECGERLLWTDGPLSAQELGAPLAERLHFAGPWGQGFPEPLFDNVLLVVGQSDLRGAHRRLSVHHPEGGAPIEAIAFNETRVLPGRARFLYRLGINDFSGQSRPQLVVEHVDCD